MDPRPLATVYVRPRGEGGIKGEDGLAPRGQVLARPRASSVNGRAPAEHGQLWDRSSQAQS